MNAPKRDDRVPPPVDDDDEELELEPPDESMEARQRQIAIDAIRSSIDIDAIYNEADRDYGGEALNDWFRNFRFQFQVKHLLIATAVISIILALIRLQLFWSTFVIGFMLAIAGIYLYTTCVEQKQQAEAARRREAIYARRRAKLAANMAGRPLEEDELPEESPLPNVIDEIWHESLKKESFRFQFSLRQLLILITAAGLVLGVMNLLGGAAVMASVLGLVALFGLVLYAVGVEAPQLLVLGWWIILVMYVLLSISTAILSMVR